MEKSHNRFLVSCIQLLPFGQMPGVDLDPISAGLENEFGLPCEVLNAESDLSYAFNSSRQQYSSTEILARMSHRPIPPGSRLLGIASVDLYIPILTFVFGEAQFDGACAVVSLHRLRPEFYGLSSDHESVQTRILKEAVHELGHTVALAHCDNYACVMAASHSVERIDLKSIHFCSGCRNRVVAGVKLPNE
jgi:archaemetzincin